MPSPDLQARLIGANQAAVKQVRARVEAFLRATWTNLGSWRDADVQRWVGQAVPVVLGAQRQVASLTDAYLAQLLGVGPTGVPFAQVTGAAVRGVDPAEVYQRPGKTVWGELSNGAALLDAVARGADRAVSIAMTDLQLTKTHSARYVLDRHDGVVGYRRVLTGSHSCGLCAVASTQRYHKRDLMPIHPACDCAVAPIIGSEDPGQVIDEQRLQATHDAIQERFGISDRGARDPIDYRHALVINHHGEIGPVLGVRGQHFTGPGDI
jgi:hypothetical protein